DAEKRGMPPVRWKIVRTHPGSGRKSLFIGSHANRILGWPVPEGRMFLLDHVTQPPFVYRHEWEVGDLVIWDNRCVLHRATPYDTVRHQRLMQRTTVSGDPAESSWLAGWPYRA
ncbi:MAG TPA: TauD/TfdA family dioxygenase, partial [Methylomirabilota bacterium]